MNPCACAEHAETFTELVTSAAHWELELFIMLVFDGLVLGLAWPFLKRHFQHHLIHDKAHQETTPTPGIAPYDPHYDEKFKVRPVIRDGRFELEARRDESPRTVQGEYTVKGPFRRT